ncbi:MAG: rod shape-determining protein RodA [Saprospiraceae bacterium]|nr:rod shape-determining protein RodA [Saprospiraceae bacterium]
MIGSNRKKYFDWITLGIYLSLLTIGWLSIYSATSSFNENVDYLDISIPIVKQSVYMVSAILIFMLAQFIDWRFWHTFAYLIYGLALLLLLIVLIVGNEINGAKAWFIIGGFSFQPSEFAKFATAISVSSYLAYFKVNLKAINFQWIVLGLILAPVLLILFQPDAGSAITFFSLFILLYTEGLNPLYYIIGIVLLIIFICSIIFPLQYVFISILILALLVSLYNIRKFKYLWLIVSSVIGIIIYLFIKVDPLYGYLASSVSLIFVMIILWRNRNERFAIFVPVSVVVLLLFSYSSLSVFSGLKEHQQERIKVWLKPSECDPRGSLYNILQSKVAIGSGGLFGKGFLNGNMTRLKYVPEQSTDFIFSTIGEEHGFIGSILVIGLFFFLVFRILDFSENCNNKFASFYSTSLAGFLILHVIINIGMTLGLVPIIGIPLPFISKGGSSLIIFSLMLGIFMRLQAKSQ